jgi:hypothetical protein
VFETFGKWIVERITIPGFPTWLSIVLLSTATAAVSLAITAFALVQIPSDYFVGPKSPQLFRRPHPALALFDRVFRNLIGWFLIALGVALSLPGVPGQGLLTILLGVMLIDFPGKRRMEQRFVAWPRVRDPINALRRRFGREPLRLDPRDEGGPPSEPPG